MAPRTAVRSTATSLGCRRGLTSSLLDLLTQQRYLFRECASAILHPACFPAEVNGDEEQDCVAREEQQVGRVGDIQALRDVVKQIREDSEYRNADPHQKPQHRVLLPQLATSEELEHPGEDHRTAHEGQDVNA